MVIYHVTHDNVNTPKDNISTRSFTMCSLLQTFVMDAFSQNHKTIFICQMHPSPKVLTCMFALQTPLLICSISCLPMPRKQNFKHNSLKNNLQSISSSHLDTTMLKLASPRERLPQVWWTTSKSLKFSKIERLKKIYKQINNWDVIN